MVISGFTVTGSGTDRCVDREKKQVRGQVYEWILRERGGRGERNVKVLYRKVWDKVERRSRCVKSRIAK